ncbi:MAG: energy transducer TonB [Acidisphaera sp.]|nr:energy transducer TonB [Acidisphaera sp.]
MPRGALLSVGLHLLIGAALALRFAFPVALTPPPPILAQIELVQQNTPTVGDNVPDAVKTRQAAPPSPAAAPVPVPPLPQGGTAAPPPTPVVRAEPTPPSPPVQQAANAVPSVRLGDVGGLGTGLVSGPNIIPAGPDSTVHNTPPVYPLDAARMGEAGKVVLTVHIAPDGSADGVDITQTSGYERLDRAAHDAVARWHFHPAQRGGVAIASTMPVTVDFVLKD